METPQLGPTPPRRPDVEVDESVWRAVAGSSVMIPDVNSEVYYFPEGHLEQCFTVKNYNFTKTTPVIPAKVISVRFLCNPISDVAFASILLQPIKPFSQRPMSEVIDGADNDDDVVSFAKILTPSDSNNGGGFSVPKFCADMILPQMNLTAYRPVQKLVMTDTLNNEWGFRHIFRGNPLRHLLTTGWTKYVNAKKLVAGDSVVFMRKKSTNKLFLGLRRAGRYVGDGSADGDEAAAAIEKAVRGLPFEVVYYPKSGVADFVVQAEKVNESLRVRWNPGMRVRMTMKKEDSSSLMWTQGVITSVAPPATGPWCRSPWRMLQVNWEDEEIPEKMKSVSPWEVEYIPLIDNIPSSKRLKLMQDSGLMHEFSHDLSTLSPIQFSHSSMVQLMNSAPVLLNYSPFPAGMKRARPDTNEDDQLNDVSTVLSIGISSPDIASSSGSGGGAQPPPSSFKLFGRTIQVKAAANGKGKGKGFLICNDKCSCSGKGCISV